MALEANLWEKTPKLPNWHQTPLGGPISSQISPNGHELLKWHGWFVLGQWLHLGKCGCGKMDGLESQCNINCTKSSQIWAKSHSSTPSQLGCPHSMNGSALSMMVVQTWLVYWARMLMWVWKPQFDLAFDQLSHPSPPHSVLKLKKQ